LLLLVTMIGGLTARYGPLEIAVAQPLADCAPASSFTVWSAPLVKLGASFLR
jgi:hypothetical protein